MPALPKQELRQLVATACTDDALSQLLELLAGVPKYAKAYDAMILLSGQWQDLKQNTRLGLLTDKDASTPRARINAAVLGYLSELPDEIAPPKSAATAPEVVLRQNIQAIAADTAWEYDLFFSFSSKDLEAARKFCHVLRGHGLRVFFSADDLRLRGGHNFANVIDNALKRSRNFLLFCSTHAMASEWVELEHDTFFQNYHLTNKHTRGFFIAEGPGFHHDLVPTFYRRSQRIQDPETLLQSLLSVGATQNRPETTPAGSPADAIPAIALTKVGQPQKANPADDASWKIACKINTIAAYQGYLDKWENGLHDAEAEQKIENLANDEELWDYINAHSNAESLEDNLLEYLETFPDGLHAIEARTQIAESERKRAEEDQRVKANAKRLAAEESALRKKAASGLKSEKQKVAHKKVREDEAPLERERAAIASAGATLSHAGITPKNGQVIRDLPGSPAMVFVEGGTFQMGSELYDGEKPIHSVKVPSFWIGKYPVTFDEYDAFCSDTGYSKPNDEGWGRGTRPVIYVNWKDAQAYCKWLSAKTGKQYRLPSEAEWEYAARGGVYSKMTRYSGSNELDEVGWFKDNSGGKTHPVGEKKANELGLHDMTGNVGELCQDGISSDYNGAPDDGSAWNRTSWIPTSRLRGGGWDSWPQGESPFYTACHVTSRSASLRVLRLNMDGFRIARDL